MTYSTCYDGYILSDVTVHLGSTCSYVYTHVPVLYEDLVAPLCGEVGVGPLGVDVEEGEVVPVGVEEILASCVRVDGLVLWSVEDGSIDGQHCSDGQDLLDHLVMVSGQYHLGHHRVHR